MPPVFAPRWVVRMRVCFLTRFTPSTSTLSSLGYAAMTLPLRPLSRPAMTTTVSPFLTFMALHHLRRQRDDFHVALPPQLPADRAEDTRTTRVAALLDDDGGVLVELDVRAVGAPLLLGGADDARPDDVALLHAGTRDGVLDGRHDDIADARVPPAGATEYPDAQDLPGSGVVGDAQSRLLLDHVSLLRLPVLRSGTGAWRNNHLARSRISTTRHRLVADSGRVSISSTRSPMPHCFSSCAFSLLVRRITLPYNGCFTWSSTATTTVFSILSLTT